MPEERKVKKALRADRRPTRTLLRTMNDRRAMDHLLIPHSFAFRGSFFANVGCSLAGVAQMERETVACPVGSPQFVRSGPDC